jgi:HAD superfamily hydrolase (TIGR01549 family)
MHRLCGIVTDVAGTITSAKPPLVAFQKLAKLTPHLCWTESKIIDLMGQSKRAHLRSLCTSDEEAADLKSKYDELLARELSSNCALLPGVINVLRALRSEYGLKIGINTGYERHHLDMLLNQWPADLFDNSVASDEVPRGRPFPDAIRKICVKWQCQPTEVLAVGDTIYDVQAAQNAGSHAVGLTRHSIYGEGSQDKLSGPNCRVCADWRDLLSYIRRFNACRCGIPHEKKCLHWPPEFRTE